MRVLALLSGGFGVQGGIGAYNRDVLSALCADPRVTEVVGVLRTLHHEPGALPAKLTHVAGGANSKVGFLAALARRLVSDRRFDLILCGHILLLPAAWGAKLLTGAPILLELYGIDAWKPTGRLVADRLAPRVDGYVAISEFTRERFLGWAPGADGRVALLPNAIHAEDYGPGEKSEELLRRYGLEDRTVLMTLGRIAAAERAKGFDEMLEILPKLAEDVPDVSYLIVGEGDDLARLERKAAVLGVRERVVFTGFISEEEKADHYRLTDVYAMPSCGEGFGFVFLEAMACGVPVVGSCTDGGVEPLRGGELGLLVDPGQPEQILAAIRQALSRPKAVPKGLAHFSYDNFEKRLQRVLDGFCSAEG
ncbi:MAG: glycosyltransferase family 4 protein [Myxococcales bacterium]|nr:glycosyltransferase family 4 protein [Myxococcales bacterium]